MAQETVYILGSGAVGAPLAAYLAEAGRQAIAVRTSRSDVQKSSLIIGVENGAERIRIPVESISLSRLAKLDGTIVIAAKSYANPEIARELAGKAAGPIVIMQNGVGVEKPFLEAQLTPVYRCVLYVTSQSIAGYEFRFRPITASPIGVIAGDTAGLDECVERLTTARFPFRAEADIQKEIWRKAIINSVFNSICPLLEVDNGIFAREATTADLAGQVVRECVRLTDRLGLGLREAEIMEQLMRISRGSEGQLISTLQDLRSGRRTEIESLNLEIARIAASQQPPLPLPRTELLGKLILLKSAQAMTKGLTYAVDSAQPAQ